MHDLSQPLITWLLTLAGATALTACIEGQARDDTPKQEEGVNIDDAGEAGGLPETQGGGDGEAPPICETSTASASNVAPNVMLVLDKSRSMILHDWDDDDDPQTPEVTRWYSLHRTVDTITTHYEDAMRLGVTLFPSIKATSSGGQACLVESSPDVATGLGNAWAILAAIPDADNNNLFGATPAAAGMTTALAHLEQLDDGRPAAMILVTDGAANCDLEQVGDDRFAVYDEHLPLVVADAWERAGIPTYVIGIDIETHSMSPLTNPYEKLDELAQLGGVARGGKVGFYDATNADMLVAALDEIASAVSCTVELSPAPSNPDQLEVVIAGQSIPQLDSCADGYGWTFTDPEGPLDTIELCNAACVALHEAGSLEAEFLCPPQP